MRQEEFLGLFVRFLFCGLPILLLIGFVVVYRYLKRPILPEFRKVLKYARKYSRNNPKARSSEIREACLDKFAPEPEEERGALGSGAILGVGGMAGAAAGRWFIRGANDSARRKIEALIDDVLDRLDEDKESDDPRNSPKSED